MLIRSFQEVFPHTSVWYKQRLDFCVLIGTEEPLNIDLQDFERRLAQPKVLARMPANDVQNAYDLLDTFCSTGDRLRQGLGDGPLHTDDHPLVEFHCARPYAISYLAKNARLLYEIREPVQPYLTNVPPDRADDVRTTLDRWYAGTQKLLAAQFHWAVLSKSSPAEPDYPETLRLLETALAEALAINPADGNAAYLQRFFRAEHELKVGRLLMKQGRYREAETYLRTAASRGTGDAAAAAVARQELEDAGLWP